MGSTRLKFSKLANLIVFLIIFTIMSLPIHEGGHSLAAQCFGAEGYIELNWFTVSGMFHGSGDLETWQFAIVAFAGGGFVALLYGLMLWFANVGIKWDEDDKTPIRFILCGQLGYALGEISLAFEPDLFPILGGIGTFLGLAVGLFWSLPKLARWWDQ